MRKIKDLITSTQLSKLLDCSLSNIYRLVRVGVVKPIRLKGSRRIYFNEKDLAKLME